MPRVKLTDSGEREANLLEPQDSSDRQKQVNQRRHSCHDSFIKFNVDLTQCDYPEGDSHRVEGSPSQSEQSKVHEDLNVSSMSETESTCTVRMVNTSSANHLPEELSKTQGQQLVLSAEALLAESCDSSKTISAKSSQQDDDFFELVDLDDSQSRELEMQATYRQYVERKPQQEPQAQKVAPRTKPDHRDDPNSVRITTASSREAPRVQGFAESQPKLSAASRRVKEYLESFEETKRNSRRIELNRLYQFFKSIRTELVACLLFTLISSQALISLRLNITNEQLSESNQVAHVPAKATTSPTGDSGATASVEGRARVQFAHGLADAFTVATLTQVFGHISGCHLSPAVSLALYIKGHINSLRLASYFLAQSVGPLIGVALLAALTSSQVTPIEYKSMLTNNRLQLTADKSLAARVSRARRDAKDIAGGEDIDLDAGRGSEKILLSILDQVEARQRGNGDSDRRQATIESEPLERRTLEPFDKTISQRDSSQVLGVVNLTLNSTPPTNQIMTSLAGNRSQFDLAPSDGPTGAKGTTRQVKVKRRLRRSRQNGSEPLASEQQAPSDQWSYVNLLEFALPDAVMSSESISDCIVGQHPSQDMERAAGINSDKQSPGTSLFGHERRALLYCVSMSNGSQMFVLQLLATILVVLTYLINADPRHVDLGFKSLSIGLSYFVAHILTVQSGGYFANPTHILSLTWLTWSLSLAGQHQDSVWRSEWIVYLMGPLIAGLLGAMSHEYIDFTSLRNRNRRLHLRRSFYSLEDIETQVAGDCDSSRWHRNNERKAAETCDPKRHDRSSSSDCGSACLGATSLVSLATGHAHQSVELEPMERQHHHQQVQSAPRAKRQPLARTQKEAINARHEVSARTSDFDPNFLVGSSSLQMSSSEYH